MTDDAPFLPDWASPPGHTIERCMMERGFLKEQFADRMRLTMHQTDKLLSGHLAITDEMAGRLETVLGSTAQFWIRRELHYREALARLGLSPGDGGA